MGVPKTRKMPIEVRSVTHKTHERFNVTKVTYVNGHVRRIFFSKDGKLTVDTGITVTGRRSTIHYKLVNDIGGIHEVGSFTDRMTGYTVTMYCGLWDGEIFVPGQGTIYRFKGPHTIITSRDGIVIKEIYALREWNR